MFSARAVAPVLGLALALALGACDDASPSTSTPATVPATIPTTAPAQPTTPTSTRAPARITVATSGRATTYAVAGSGLVLVRGRHVSVRIRARPVGQGRPGLTPFLTGRLSERGGRARSCAMVRPGGWGGTGFRTLLLRCNGSADVVATSLTVRE